MLSPIQVRPKSLVLGGNGFIGRHLVDLLVSEGVPVRVLTRNATRADLPPSVEVIEGSFVDGVGVAQALEGVEVVYHLVSTSIPNDPLLSPTEDVYSNLTATLRLLTLMARCGVKRIVYASSGGTVYGNPFVLPVPESHPLQPICSYGIVKVAIESYLALHQRNHDFVTNILRISNPYGAGQTRIGQQGVISTFVQRLAAGQPVEIWGDGSAMRDYIHVSDVARALSIAGRRLTSGTFNIGSGVGHTVNQVFEIIQDLMQVKGCVSYKSKGSRMVDRTYLDIQLAQRELNWSPRFSLRDGCMQFVQATLHKVDRPSLHLPRVARSHPEGLEVAGA